MTVPITTITIPAGSFVTLPISRNDEKTVRKVPVPPGEYTNESFNTWICPYVTEQYGPRVQATWNLTGN